MGDITLNKWKRDLGLKVKDRLTGFEGILVSRSVNLYGENACLIQPTVDSMGRLPSPCWFEESRIIFYDQ